MQLYDNVIEIIGLSIDAIGVLIIIVGAGMATARFLFRRSSVSYTRYRQDLGRSILLSLEFLIAGDIIRTVVVAPTLANVVTLGIIVVIRITLSIALHMEIEGRWPWQQAGRPSRALPEKCESGRGQA